MKKGTFALIAVAGLATAASGQNQPPPPTAGTFRITSSNVVSPTSPSTTIEFYAIWTGPLYLFGASNYDLHARNSAGVGDGTFSNEANILNPLGQLGTSAGTPAGPNVTGASNGQLHAPPFFFGNQANPLLLATYTWETTDFTVRTVDLSTSGTVGFLTALIADWGSPPPPNGVFAGTTFQMLPGEFTPGSGSIEVIPAPSALALLGLGGLVAARRRR